VRSHFLPGILGESFVIGVKNEKRGVKMEDLIKLCEHQIDVAQKRQDFCKNMWNGNLFGGSVSYWQHEYLNALNEQLKWERTKQSLESRSANIHNGLFSEADSGDAGSAQIE